MKAGLEVHQQLATGKLFCRCPSELSEQVRTTITRQLRATGGELKEVDPAAAFEAALGLTFRYELVPTNCLVEIDEEPPNVLDADALDVALTMALLLEAQPLDEIQVMRKIVIDGSNTAGFQRTALVAVDGILEVRGRTYSIPTICLEEDAARRIGEGEGEVRYRLDRLGIPLIEITTGPDMTSPEEIRDVAAAIGALLRSTHRVRRGIGTIREDLNLSVEGGSRIEIKGVQELRLLPGYAEEEVVRQEMLLRVKEELRARAAPRPEAGPTDVSELLRSSADGAPGVALRDGGVVLALPLPGFAGLLGRPGDRGPRLGRELADQARTASVHGILHSDELPSNGVGEEQMTAIRARLSLGPLDAFVLVAHGDPRRATLALDKVRARAATAYAGVPPETRDPLPDGTSCYSRPLPGRDRMYPETDVPPVTLDPGYLAQVRERLPEPPARAKERFVREYGLGPETVGVLLREGETERFERLAARGHAPAVVARLLTQELPGLLAAPRARAVADLSDDLLHSVLSALAEGRFAKEGLGPVLTGVAADGRSVDEAIAAAGFSALSPTELDRLIGTILDRNASLVGERGTDAFSALMGDVMREVRGRRDGREVADRLRQALARRLAGGAEAA